MKELRAEIKDLHGKIEALRIPMHSEFGRFYMTLGQPDAKIENLEKKVG